MYNKLPLNKNRLAGQNLIENNLIKPQQLCEKKGSFYVNDIVGNYTKHFNN